MQTIGDTTTNTSDNYKQGGLQTLNVKPGNGFQYKSGVSTEQRQKHYNRCTILDEVEKIKLE